MMGNMLKVLEGFHHWADRQITGMKATRGVNGEWEYPPVAAALEAAGIHPKTEYIRRRQETIAKRWPASPFMNSAPRRSG